MKFEVYVLEWSNGNVDIFADEDEAVAAYQDQFTEEGMEEHVRDGLTMKVDNAIEEYSNASWSSGSSKKLIDRILELRREVMAEEGELWHR